MDRTITLPRTVDLVPAEGLPWRQRHALHLAAPLPRAINPTTPVDAKAPVPPQPREMGHELRVGEPTLRRPDDGTLEGKQRSHPLQHIFGDGIGHTAPGRREAFPPPRHGSAPRDEEHAHHTVGIPQG
jgi:hypothetical protein